MENFVFPDEIKTKLIKMNKLMNIFSRPLKIMQKCSKLYAFSLIWKHQENALFYSHHSYMETWIKLGTTYKPPQGPHGFSKVHFFTFEPAILESIGDNHTVSDSVFKVTRIIE